MLKLNKIYLWDCLEVMNDIPDGSIDCIITSPPYEDIAWAWYTANSKDILFIKLYSDFIDKLFIQYQRILKDWWQLFFNVKSKTNNKTLRTPHWIEFTDWFQRLDFKSYIIRKYAWSFDSTEARFHLDYEIIYHLSKWDIKLKPREWLNDWLSSLWYIPHTIKDRVHPTQMPIAVVDNIIERAGITWIVLDSFMWSWTTAISCKNHWIDYIWCELNPKYVDIANERLKNTTISLFA